MFHPPRVADVWPGVSCAERPPWIGHHVSESRARDDAGCRGGTFQKIPMCNVGDNGPGYSDIESESETYCRLFSRPTLSARDPEPAAAVHVAVPDVALTAPAVGKWAEHRNPCFAHRVPG